jgi:hypothetical protein
VKSEVYICDECQATKKDVNHWWLLSSPERTVAGEIIFSPWNDDIANDDGVKHLCGQACVIQAVSKSMTEMLISAAEAEAKR